MSVYDNDDDNVFFQIADESGLTAADMITALKRAGFD